MNNYLCVDTTADPKIIGPLYPQMECIEINLVDGLDKISENKGLKVGGVDRIHNLKVGKGGKLTDIMSCGLGAGGDFLISNKFLTILKNFQTDGLQFFEMEFQFNKKIISDYKWAHFVYAWAKHIDFANSEFDDYQIEDINNHKPQSYAEYVKMIKHGVGKYNRLRLKKTVLKNSFPLEQDFFVLCQANQKKYISTPLYSEIIKNSITGLESFPANDLIFKL